MRVVGGAGDEALERLVVDDPRLADAARLEDPARPEVGAGPGQRERAEREGSGEGGGGGEPFADASGEEEVRDEDGGGELDPGGDTDRDASAEGAGGPGDVPEDQTDEHQVDLPEEDGLEDGLQPQGEGGSGEEGREARGEPGEAPGEVDQEGEEGDVAPEEGELEGGEGKPGGGHEEERGERRIGGRQLPPGDGEPVEIPTTDDGGPFGPVDEGIGHGERLHETEEGEGAQRGEGQQDHGKRDTTQ